MQARGNKIKIFLPRKEMEGKLRKLRHEKQVCLLLDSNINTFNG